MKKRNKIILIIIVLLAAIAWFLPFIPITRSKPECMHPTVLPRSREDRISCTVVKFKSGKNLYYNNKKIEEESMYKFYSDSDNDGVLNEEDICSNDSVSDYEYTVDANGCLVFESFLDAFSHNNRITFNDLKNLENSSLKNLDILLFNDYKEEYQSMAVRPKNIEELQKIIDKATKELPFTTRYNQVNNPQ